MLSRPLSSAPASDGSGVFPKVHLHLHVTDLESSIGFYRALFGEGPIKQRSDYAKFLPGWAPVNLALSRQSTTVAGGSVSHVGIQLADAQAVQRQLDRVRATGLPVRVELGVDCCHANQDKFWVRDPSGLEWEIYVLNHDLTDDAIDHETPATLVPTCCAPGCCAS